MKILVDENMPYAGDLFRRLGEVKAVPGRPIPAAELADADALMVRSVTKVNEALLSGTPIKFVGTATAGTDHVDEQWLQQAGIGFSAAPGCNAIAVVEYDIQRKGGILAELNWWLMAWDMDPAWKGGHGGGEETAAILGIDPSLVDQSVR